MKDGGPLIRHRVLEFDELEDRLVPTLLGQQLFPHDHPWNQQITNAPVAANSAAIMANIGLGVDLHPDFGQFYGDGSDLYGIPYNIVSGTQPKVSVVIDDFPDESDIEPVPIPAGAVLEGDFQDGPRPLAQRGDSHLIVWDKDNNIAYELFHASRPSENGDGQWHAAGQAVWHMATNSFRTLGWTSADAAGLSILAGLVRPDEGLPVAQGGQGVINHAIRFTLTNSRVLGKYIYPASHEANSGTDTSILPPMGTRFRLKASVDISGLKPQAKIIAQAMKDYGLILADNGSSMFFSGASYAVDADNDVTLTWDDDDIQDATFGLKSLEATDFEVVDLRPRVTSVDHASAAPGSTLIVTGQNFSGSASSGGTNRLFVMFGSTPVAATYISDTQVSATVPIGSGPVTIRVRSGIVSPEGGNILDPIFGYGDSTTSASFTIVPGPVVQSIMRADTNPTNAGSVAFTVTFSSNVSNVDLGDFTLNTTGVTGASVTNVSGSGDTYTVTVNTGSGSGIIRLDVVDNDSILDESNNNPLGGTGVGNGNFITGQTYTIDRAGPHASAITRANADPTNAASVAFTVTFDEPVIGVDVSDFDLTTTGVSGATIGVISGAGTIYMVNVDTGSNSGTIRLDLTDNDSITDLAGNALGESGSGNGDFTGGQVYTIDKTGPTVTVEEAVGQTDPVAGGAVLFTVVFDEPVADFTAADVTIGGTANPHQVSVTGSGTTYTVAVSGMKQSGTVTATLAAGVAGDALSNPSAASTSIDNTINFTLPPDLVGVFRNGRWWRDSDGGRDFDEAFVVLGKKGDKPIRGDFDGDGTEENGVFRGAGRWLIDLDHNGTFNEGRYATYGTTDDKPVVGDWDNDGDDDVGIYRQGRWWLDDGDRIKNELRIVFGSKGYQSATGDWDGDGDDDIAIFRAGRWYRDSNDDGLFNDTFFASYGQAGDKVAVGDWDGDGTSDVGIFRSGQWFCDDGDLTFDEVSFTFGVAGDTPVVGK